MTHPEAARPGPRVLRTDIQALRGFAVVIVLLYHAQLPGFGAGYLGVDVFFVISGFLITRLVSDGLRRGGFSMAEFYVRRAKRLLPAAYVTFLATAVAALFFLNDPELLDFRAQLLGGLTFTANIVLWRQSGYFEGDADLKPLLHVWSLSLEEQYYFILPALLVVLPRRAWIKVLTGAVLASLLMFALRAGRDSTFYLLPTRLWELGMGSVGALLIPGERLQRALTLAFPPALLLLALVPFSAMVPGSATVATLAACLAALVVILRAHPGWVAIGPARGLSRVGDISYSLYLVHWPLFAFLHNSWFGSAGSAPPLLLRLTLLAASFVLAVGLYRTVEYPAHHATIRRKRQLVWQAGAASLLLVGIAYLSPMVRQPARDYAMVLQPNFGFGRSCDLRGDFTPRPECRSGPSPRMLIWGDSFAMHLVPGLAAADSLGGVIQATRSACGPVLGVAPLDEPWYDRAWGRSCMGFNDGVLAYLEATPAIEVVVLASPFTPLVDAGNTVLVRDQAGFTFSASPSSVGLALEMLDRTITRLRQAGKRVVVVGPPPQASYDVGRCLERVERGMPVLGVRDGCLIEERKSEAALRWVLELLKALQTHANVDVIDLAEHLCGGGRCLTAADGVFLYRDQAHLSREGSAYLARSMNLPDLIRARAR